MFHNLKYVALVGLLVYPLAADAQQSRGGRAHQQQRARSARAEAMAPPKQLAQTLLPAGARRTNERFEAPRDGWGRWPQSNRGWWKHQRYNHYPFGYVRQGYGASYYAVPYAGFVYGTAAADEGEYAPPPPMPDAMSANKGLLQFEITPSSGLDYYIDGIHVGSSSNLGSEFEVNAGARQIEVRARGYRSAIFDRRIEGGRVTTVRGTLEAIEQPQAPRSTGGQIMYVIPGCYMGNARPVAAALPPGCDIKKLVTRGGL